MFKKGYTTIELMTTLSMIAIMASIALPSYQAMRTEARYAKAKAEVKTLQSLIERYRSVNSKLPENMGFSKMDNKLNITDQDIEDAFAQAEPYSLEKGQTGEGREYYIIYSKGENGIRDYTVGTDRVYNKGDDIVASNLPVINPK